MRCRLILVMKLIDSRNQKIEISVTNDDGKFSYNRVVTHFWLSVWACLSRSIKGTSFALLFRSTTLLAVAPQHLCQKKAS